MTFVLPRWLCPFSGVHKRDSTTLQSEGLSIGAVAVSVRKHESDNFIILDHNIPSFCHSLEVNSPPPATKIPKGCCYTWHEQGLREQDITLALVGEGGNRPSQAKCWIFLWLFVWNPDGLGPRRVLLPVYILVLNQWQNSSVCLSSLWGNR